MKEIINFARNMGASDIHFVSGMSPAIRKDGEIETILQEQYHKDYTQDLLNLIPEYLKENFDNGYDADFAYKDENEMRYRVNIFRQMGQVGGVIRLLNEEIPTLNQLNMPSVLKDLSMLPRGLVLLTGPTGSGKSTTLAAMINHANQNRKCNIITIEDPIEYVHTAKNSILSQREVGKDTISFSHAIRSAMREDPDIILVGEMRDFETISAAVTAAETGHLVLSTLHTTGAARTVERIIDVFPPHQQSQIRAQVASVLKGVVTQQLVKKKSGGRCAALEIMICNDAISNMIREGKAHQIDSAIQTSGNNGMILMDKHLSELVNDGIISEAEAQVKCCRLAEMKRYISPKMRSIEELML